MTGVTFDELRSARHELASLAALHGPSLSAFRLPEKNWFRVYMGEPKERDDQVHHLTASASCLESLCDRSLNETIQEVQDLIDSFAQGAIERERWVSEGAAQTYARVRALPLILERANPAIIKAATPKLEAHLDFIWRDVNRDLDAQGVREHSEDRRVDVRYPPNAFLTFWALRTLQAAKTHPSLSKKAHSLKNKERFALSWSERVVGTQVAFHAAGSDQADPHQLAWAIASLVNFTTDRVQLKQLPRLELLRAGLGAFFDQQRDGGWKRGQPLFHFPDAGNAYCYVFESLTELIRPAVRTDLLFYREMLMPHMRNLLDAWHLSERTKEEDDNGCIGWCSRHHPHRTEPESWATAEVFSYIQLLRALVGTEAGSHARQELRATALAGETDPVDDIRKRGDTWTLSAWTGANLLGTLFLNPVFANARAEQWLNPNAPLIDKDQARSVILFGPPGTSKTSLVEALARSIQWDYVEVHATDFLREGMDNVPAQADRIFQLIMELDRAVVLFDEVDELVRVRTGGQSDPFGRFLTTSMLPKLAKLWSQRRVLYFLNTNLIDEADPAIRRSQRFDAAIYILPPAFGRKKALIEDLLTPDAQTQLTKDGVDGAIERHEVLGWFALIRFDQIAELRARLERSAPAGMNELSLALGEIGKRLVRSDWHVERNESARSSDELRADAFERFINLQSEESVDYSKWRVCRVLHPLEHAPDGYEILSKDGSSTYLRMPVSLAQPPLDLLGDTWRGVADEVLWFETTAVEPPLP